MKLVFTEKKGTVDCQFKGSPQAAVQAIVTSMSQSDLVHKIIMIAAQTFEQLGDKIKDEVEENSVVKVETRKTIN